MKLIVIVESPYAGNIERNVRYARAALRDCLMRGEAPYASHLLYTQEGVLRDGVPEERKLGIEAGFEFRAVAGKRVFYTDLGISLGMEMAIEDCKTYAFPFEIRRLSAADFFAFMSAK